LLALIELWKFSSSYFGFREARGHRALAPYQETCSGGAGRGRYSISV